MNLIHIFDTYNPFRKTLSGDYPTDYTLLGLIEPIVATELPVPHHQFNTNLYYGMRNNEEVKHLQECLIYLGFLGKGLTTGNYLELTRLAFKKFLIKYQVTSPFWININNGRWVLELSRKKLNEIFK